MRETVAQFGRGSALTGIVASPLPQNEDSSLPAVVLLGAGLIHRIGPGRLYVRLARELASMGVRTLRFDYSGVGDSRATDDDRSPRDRCVAETRSAMDYLANVYGSTTFVLGGVCSGASLGYLTARADDRVAELWLMNPPAPVLTRRYLRVLRSHPNRWRRLAQAIGHRVRGTQTRTSEGESAASHDIVGGLHSLATRGVKMLVVTSEWDAGFDYLNGVLPERLAARGIGSAVEVVPIPGADHLFQLVEHQTLLVGRILSRVEDLRRSTLGGSHASPKLLDGRGRSVHPTDGNASPAPDSDGTAALRLRQASGGTRRDADFTSYPKDTRRK